MLSDINQTAFSMMSQEFHFTDKKPLHPMHKNIGIKRVVSVVIHESEPPEIGLFDPSSSDKDDIDFISLDRVQVKPVLLPESA